MVCKERNNNTYTFIKIAYPQFPEKAFLKVFHTIFSERDIFVGFLHQNPTHSWKDVGFSTPYAVEVLRILEYIVITRFQY